MMLENKLNTFGMLPTTQRLFRGRENGPNSMWSQEDKKDTHLARAEDLRRLRSSNKQTTNNKRKEGTSCEKLCLDSETPRPRQDPGTGP